MMDPHPPSTVRAMSAGDLWPCEKGCVYPGPMEVAVIRRRSEIVRRVIFSRKGWDRKSFGFSSSGGWGGTPLCRHRGITKLQFAITGMKGSLTGPTQHKVNGEDVTDVLSMCLRSDILQNQSSRQTIAYEKGWFTRNTNPFLVSTQTTRVPPHTNTNTPYLKLWRDLLQTFHSNPNPEQPSWGCGGG